MFKEVSLYPCEYQFKSEAPLSQRAHLGQDLGCVMGNTNTNLLFQAITTKTPCLSRGVFGSGIWIPAGFWILSQNSLRCLCQVLKLPFFLNERFLEWELIVECCSWFRLTWRKLSLCEGSADLEQLVQKGPCTWVSCPSLFHNHFLSQIRLYLHKWAGWQWCCPLFSAY